MAAPANSPLPLRGVILPLCFLLIVTTRNSIRYWVLQARYWNARMLSLGYWTFINLS